MAQYPMHINGHAIPGGAHFDVINPSTGGVVGSVPSATDAEVDQAIAAARAAQADWAARPSDDRAALLQRIGDRFEEESERIASLITQEQGKPLSGPGSMFEMEAVVGFTRVPASLDVEPEVVFEDDTRLDVLHYVPLGVVAAIAPWNWPAMIAIWQMMPSIRMGNTVVIKPSEYTPIATLELVAIMNEILPPGVVNIVTGAGDVGARLTSSPDVDKIMFTGSVETGRKVAAAASTSLARLTLELGGNDAAIVLDDVDASAIAEGLFWGAFVNMGQTCACAKRLYVQDAVHDEVVEALVNLANVMPMGDGLDPANVLGPIQNTAQFDKVSALVEDAKKSGATIHCGGVPTGGPGNFYPITVVSGITDGVDLVDVEQFGPVIPVIRVGDEADAIARANASTVALGASVWSSNPERASAVAAQLDAGTVWVNQHGAVHPMVPFGGAKGSGFGLEFGIDGLKSVSQPKVISTAKTG